MSKWKVYISSTFRDLKNFRADLIHLFQNQLKNNFELCEIMERMFDDGTYTPFADDCVQAVLESDIYIIILGNKTGSFPPNEDRTYTEIELDTALANDKKIFCLHLEEFDEAKIDNKAKHDELLGKFKGRPIHTFKDAKDLKSALYEFLIQFTSQSPVNAKNPYKGLASFNVEDGEYFFGRDAEIENCLKRIITSNGNFFVSVIGNSGTGKSSFVKAGLMFRLKTKEEYGFTKRQQILVTPASEPFTNLKYQMQLQGNSVEDVLNPNSESPDLIVFFDQFEEIITQCRTPEAQEERQQLFEFLDALACNQNSKVLVICTFRSDFLSQLANFDFIKSHQYLFPISSLDYKVHADNWEQSMSEIISRPALKNGVVLEKELVEQLLEQIKEVDGSLPILQFTLERIWNKETIADRRISSTEFNKLSEGKGISGIIETHAEKVIKSITHKGQDKERETILKTIFVNLVEVNENLNDVKRTVAKNELYSILKLYPEQEVNEVFETLVSEKSRLLNVSQNKDETINVRIIHEELIRKWERLKGWIDDRREALETKKRISLDIAAFNKGEEGLYGRKQLKRANQWKTKNPDLANEEINSFLFNSRRTNNGRLYKRSGITLLIAALVTAVILVWVQPAIQKRDFVNDSLEKNIELNAVVQEAGGLDSLMTLVINDGNYGILNNNLKHFKNLKGITVTKTKDLVDLSIFNNIKKPLLLYSLNLGNNPNLQNLSGIENLKNLTSLKIYGNENLKNLSGIENLHSLTSLEISSNDLHDLSLIKDLKSLTSLEIVQSDSLKSLSGIENLNSMTSLKIISNKNLKDLSGIKNLDSLRALEISENDKIFDLTWIQDLKDLTSLKIDRYHNGRNLPALQDLKSLTSLVISNSHSLNDLSGIKDLNSLNSLTITDNWYIQDLTGIKDLNSLNSLVISGFEKLTDLNAIKDINSLTSLDIWYCNSLTDLSGIKELDSLTSLKIFNSLTDFSGIEDLDSLAFLQISQNQDITDLRGIKDIKSLDSLVISRNHKLINLHGIENLNSLTSLEISRNGDQFTSVDLSGIASLNSLTSLIIEGNEYLQDLGVIKDMKYLKSLKIVDNDNLKDLSGIEDLHSLTSLEISGNGSLTKINGVKYLNSLTSLKIFNSPRIEIIKWINDIQQLTNLRELVINDGLPVDYELIKKNNPGLKITFLKE